jgi:putative transposase
MPVDTRREWIDRDEDLSMRRQCALLGLNRSGLYYEPGTGCRSEEDETLKRMIDTRFTEEPSAGVVRMVEWLKTQNKPVGHERVRRLMREMGLEAIYPKPRLSIPGNQHVIYPYLLRGVVAKKPDEVWATDITYIRMARGHVYLVAIMDWFSRYIVGWTLSTTMDVSFCCAALAAALERGTPEIFNSDQGSQFTSAEFTGMLKAAGIRISMDGRGRVFDNIFVERFWRTIKYEEVYVHDYTDVRDAWEHLARYIAFYNERRLHSSLDFETPAAMYYGHARSTAAA